MHRQVLGSRQVLLVGFVILLAGAALLSSSSGRAARSASCVATGPKYSHAGRSTTKYVVALAGVSCSFAKPWVARFVFKHPVQKTLSTGQVTGGVAGPAGWTCNVYDPQGGTRIPKLAYAGACVPAAPPYTKKFAWQPVL